MLGRLTGSVGEDRMQLARECRTISEEIVAYVAERPDAPPVDEARDAPDRVVAMPTQFEDDFAIQFGDRLQHLIIKLAAAGYGPDALDPLTYDGTSRLWAGRTAETLKAIAGELPRWGGG